MALLVFGGLCGVTLLITTFFIRLRDNKGNEESRKKLAEYFHKVILNNILTGLSFVKKAKIKNEAFAKLENDFKKEKDDEKKKFIEIERDTIREEIELYMCKAIYYFEAASRQMREKKIFEVGSRENYKKFIVDIDIITLEKTLSMYKRRLDDLGKLKVTVDMTEKENDIKNYVNTCQKILAKLKHNVL